MPIIYTTDDIDTIRSHGFEIYLPNDVLENIKKLTSHVGSPDYIKTPVFKKFDVGKKINNPSSLKKDKNSKKNSAIDAAEWSAIKTNKPINNETKGVIDTQIENIICYLNKMSDKNYGDMCQKIVNIMDDMIANEMNSEDMLRLSTKIFDIASANRFYSKIYADLYSVLSCKYEVMKSIFQQNFQNFTELFNVIEYVDPNVDYDKFCDVNKRNEKRKALALFYVNLMKNDVVTKSQIVDITRNLMSQFYAYISMDGKTNEVDELCEIIAILYNKELYKDSSIKYDLIEGHTINEVVEKVSKSKVKDFKSLTNKSLFKFMDVNDV